MKVFAALLVLVLGAFSLQAEEIAGVSLSIRPDTAVSSDHAAICRVTAVNHSGRTLDGRKIVFEARALEHGDVVQTAKGRFGGVVANGESVETLIGFSGPFRNFEVVASSGGPEDRSRSRGSRSAGKRGTKKGKGRSHKR